MERFLWFHFTRFSRLIFTNRSRARFHSQNGFFRNIVSIFLWFRFTHNLEAVNTEIRTIHLSMPCEYKDKPHLGIKGCINYRLVKTPSNLMDCYDFTIDVGRNFNQRALQHLDDNVLMYVKVFINSIFFPRQRINDIGFSDTIQINFDPNSATIAAENITCDPAIQQQVKDNLYKFNPLLRFDLSFIDICLYPITEINKNAI